MGDSQGQGGLGAGGDRSGQAGGADGGGAAADGRTAGAGVEGSGGEAGRDASGGGQSGSGSWPEGQGAATAGTGQDEFEGSLGDFDRIMEAEREAIARAGVGTAADEALSRAGQTRGGDEADSVGNLEAARQGGTVGGATGSGEPGAQPAMTRPGPPPEPAPRVEGCEDEDTVARQLCEAATKEDDPFLRAALWDEYNEYKKILTRQ